MKKVFAVSLMVLAFSTMGQDVIKFRSLSTADGLSQNSVNQILQDSRGYIWLATQDGLNRYNGYEFEIFRPDVEDSFSLADNFIIQMLEDDQYRLWLSTRAGIHVFDIENRRFHKLIDTIPGRIVQKYHLRKHDGFVYWKNTDTVNSISRMPMNVTLTKANNSLQEYSEQIHLAQEYIYQYVVGDSGLIVLSKGNILIPGYGLRGSETDMDGVGAQSWDYQPVGDSVLLLPGVDKIISIHQLKGKIKSINTGFSAMCFVPANEDYWVGTKTGLYSYDVYAEKTSKVSTNPSFQNTTIHDLTKDCFGQYWMGTANRGVFIYDPKWAQFQYLNSNGHIVWGYAEQGAYAYQATQNGIYVIDTATRTVVRHLLKGQKVTAIYVDSLGTLWVGTANGEIYSQAYNQLKLEAYTKVLDQHSSITGFRLDRQGNFWVASHADLVMVSPNGTIHSVEEQSKSFLYVMDLFEDRAGNIWVGLQDGVGYVKPTGQYVHIAHTKGDPRSPNFSFSSTVLEDSRGTIWVGTYGGGISRLNADSTFTHFTEKNGLSNNVIHAMEVDDQDRLWMVSNGGLSMFDTKSQTFKNYSNSNGLRSQDFALGASYHFADGRLGFGTVDGLLVFNPNRVDTLFSQPILKWERLLINYDRVLDHSLDGLKQIDLYYGDRVFSLGFAALKYDDPHDVTYKYTLEGFDEEWVDVSPQSRMVTYSSLPFGSYEFKVKACSGKGLFQPITRALVIVVHPPFWLTWWFVLLMLLTGLGLGTGLVYYLSRRKLKLRLAELETREKIQQERERISRDLHDSVGTHFAYIISRLDFLYLGWEGAHVTDKKAYLGKLSDFARSGMKMLRETIWALNEEQVSATSLKLKIDDYLKLCFTDQRTSYKFLFTSVENKVNATIALNTFRVIQEAVSNALKHAEASHLEISLNIDSYKLVLSVMDDGKGFDMGVVGEQEGHYGLQNLKKRADELNAEFSLISDGAGTKILITSKITHT
ncbi:MAG: two-component regulator propeller domain-containing protein [Marinoscillum sp.]|uniref:ligand-binding sensor domain-containing protein n=1 Tax=Marinoscillum sp. TaxID=2024838 RepID=UPI0032F140B8